MGLDVTAISNATLSTASEEKWEGIWHAYNANDKNRLDGKPEGRYKGDKEFSFRAGSYSGYNEWRRWLSTKFLGSEPETVWANPEQFEGKPFVELIDFGDNEGAFGPVTSAKLAKDFADYAFTIMTTKDWNDVAYIKWWQAFSLASHDGLVILH